MALSILLYLGGPTVTKMPFECPLSKLFRRNVHWRVETTSVDGTWVQMSLSRSWKLEKAARASWTRSGQSTLARRPN